MGASITVEESQDVKDSEPLVLVESMLKRPEVCCEAAWKEVSSKPQSNRSSMEVPLGFAEDTRVWELTTKHLQKLTVPVTVRLQDIFEAVGRSQKWWTYGMFRPFWLEVLVYAVGKLKFPEEHMEAEEQWGNFASPLALLGNDNTLSLEDATPSASNASMGNENTEPARANQDASTTVKQRDAAVVSKPAPSYLPGQLVQYQSASLGRWTQAHVLQTSGDKVELSCKPGMWLPAADSRIRPALAVDGSVSKQGSLVVRPGFVVWEVVFEVPGTLGMELGFFLGDVPMVLKIVPGSPGHAAKLQAGDRILLIDGKSVATSSSEEVLSALQDRPVTLRLERSVAGDSAAPPVGPTVRVTKPGHHPRTPVPNPEESEPPHESPGHGMLSPTYNDDAFAMPPPTVPSMAPPARSAVHTVAPKSSGRLYARTSTPPQDNEERPEMMVERSQIPGQDFMDDSQEVPPSLGPGSRPVPINSDSPRPATPPDASTPQWGSQPQVAWGDPQEPGSLGIIPESEQVYNSNEKLAPPVVEQIAQNVEWEATGLDTTADLDGVRVVHGDQADITWVISEARRRLLLNNDAIDSRGFHVNGYSFHLQATFEDDGLFYCYIFNHSSEDVEITLAWSVRRPPGLHQDGTQKAEEGVIEQVTMPKMVTLMKLGSGQEGLGDVVGTRSTTDAYVIDEQGHMTPVTQNSSQHGGEIPQADVEERLLSTILAPGSGKLIQMVEGSEDVLSDGSPASSPVPRPPMAPAPEPRETLADEDDPERPLSPESFPAVEELLDYHDRLTLLLRLLVAAPNQTEFHEGDDVGTIFLES
mmetsp:Transcript_1899/g.4298  ORF Transcript_1899/g.4298 Transcript_1899/m.4298 type:complete len:812 (-) Transcript_1899:137-2572(-)